MKLHTLEDLFVDELRDLYSAENQIVKALPKMAKAASSPELQEAFRHHLEQTNMHVDRLEQIFDELEVSPRGKVCKAMKGLIEEGKGRLKADGSEAVRDAGLIADAQRVEHYEMAGYGCAHTFAQILNHEQAATLLQETLMEEHQADAKLTEIAESAINLEAAGAG